MPHPLPHAGSKARKRAKRPKRLAPVLLSLTLFLAVRNVMMADDPPKQQIDSWKKGTASWYGEEHRGKLMANGKRFNPDRPTAASWFYPLGAKVLVTVNSPSQPRRSVLVTITDRGPAKELVREGRIIDLGQAPFTQLAPADTGLVSVIVRRIK
jgi:rare lipoprotein A